MTLGGYQVTKTHSAITAGGFVAGVIYGMATGKSIPGILLFAVIGSMAAFGIATLVERPLKVK